MRKKVYLCQHLRVRDVAQLVARHVRDVEVDSSSLFIPTDLRSRECVSSRLLDLFFCSYWIERNLIPVLVITITGFSLGVWCRVRRRVFGQTAAC